MEFGDKDFAELRIEFKPIYTIPFASIHHKIKTFEKQPDYVLASSTNNCNYDIIVNGVKVETADMLHRLHLNEYVTDKITNVKVIAKPKSNERGAPYYSATILDQNTNEIIKEIEGGNIEDSTVFETDFESKLPYYPEAWTTGIDLKKDKKIKEKVIAFYHKLGTAIVKKDQQVLNDMFYQSQYEKQQLNYDTKFETARSKWEILVNHLQNTKYTISLDFDIKFSAKGKLIYPYRVDNKEILTFDKNNYTDYFNFYLYQPKGSNELKVIR